MDRRLEIELARLADRNRRVKLHLGLSFCWFAAAGALVLSLVLGPIAGWSARVPGTAAILVCLIAAIFVYIATRRWTQNLLIVARQIEQKYPSLDHRLLAAIEQGTILPPRKLGYLQQLVVREAVDHSLRYDWHDTIPAARLVGARVVHALALVLMLAALVFVLRSNTIGSLGSANVRARTVAGQYRVSIEPGNASVERGTDVLVLARFAGSVPADVHLVARSESAATRRLALAKSLNDPMFGARITSVASDLSYYVEFDGERTTDFQITVFDYPEVLRIDAEVCFPGYAGLPTQRIEDTRQVSAVEGSTITLICSLNKPVSRAWLTDNAKNEIDLYATSGNETEYRHTITLDASRRYSVHLLDSEGRSNKLPAEIALTAIPDRLPELVLKFPVRDVRASPLEEVSLEAQAWDDFGISTYGVTTMLGGESPQSTTLGQSVPAKEKRGMQHTITLEDLKAQPDQLLSYYFWADDTGPDGKARRTRSDMFFIEVRPFEEIYRQGQQPTEDELRQQDQQNQGGGAQQAAELAELEKQIINATWKLIRQTAIQPADLARDAGVIRDSQKSARDQVHELAAQVRAPNAASAIEEIDRHMAAATDQLAQAAEQSNIEPLEPALSSEHAAYQALLKLRAREHEVIRSRRMAQRGSNAGNRANRQLDELELDASENRYENRRNPTTAQQQSANEDNQVLNRLRELARRQEDLNKRIQELQSTLEAASDSQREELKRQLERLREEQQELLRDLDELRDRMDQPENQQRMAESRDQLEQTRQNMRQASDALRQQQLSPALSSGTRAERELEQARDEFRRRTANQFADEMRSMRDDARELARREQELGDRLDQMKAAPRQALRDDERTNVVEQMAEQRKRLGDLTGEMKSLSEAAETTEPLLSKQLYDVFRDTTQRNTDRSMELTSELLRRGFVSEATQTEQNVRQDVDRLRDGIERAARSVLGDTAEATRRALEQVEDLTNQLQKEIARADPDGEAPAAQSRQRTPGTDQDSQQSEPTTSESQIARGGESETQRDRTGREANPRGSGTSDQTNPNDSQRRGSARRGSGQDARDAQATQQDSESAGTAPDARPGESRSATAGRNQPNRPTPAGDERNLDVAGWTGPAGPITGGEFRQWSDRLREVEEMLENAELRAEVAEINDRAREVRRDLKRHSQEPNWSMVRSLIAQPLVELQTKLREELARQATNDGHLLPQH